MAIVGSRVILQPTIFALPTGALPASSSVGYVQGLSSKDRPWSKAMGYHRSGLFFFYVVVRAMSLITPTVFIRDFQSPVVVFAGGPIERGNAQGAWGSIRRYEQC